MINIMYSYLDIFSLRGFSMHWVNGSPVWVGKHEHIGVWLITLHTALAPHDPMQGSLHLRLIHAKFWEHSLLLTHSNLQFGGRPIDSGKQEQVYWSFTTRHCAFWPHGDGSQGFLGVSAIGAINNSEVVTVHLSIVEENMNDAFKCLRVGEHLVKGSPL